MITLLYMCLPEALLRGTTRLLPQPIDSVNTLRTAMTYDGVPLGYTSCCYWLEGELLYLGLGIPVALAGKRSLVR